MYRTAILALGFCFLLIGSTPAQEQQSKKPNPAKKKSDQANRRGTRIAFVNMDIVLKRYKKVQFFKDELRNVAEPYRKKVKKFEEYNKRWKEIEDDNEDITDKKRVEAHKQAVLWKRKIEDLTNEANKKIMDLGQYNLIALYKELEEVTKQVAKKKGYDLVLHHFNPVDKRQRYSWANLDRILNRPMQAGSVSVLYVSPRVDISQEVLRILNERYAKEQKAKELSKEISTRE